MDSTHEAGTEATSRADAASAALGRGEAVVVGDRYGIRITEIVASEGGAAMSRPALASVIALTVTVTAPAFARTAPETNDGPSGGPAPGVHVASGPAGQLDGCAHGCTDTEKVAP